LGIKTEKGIQKVSRVIICDTGPLIHLSEAGAIHLLKLAGGIFIPPVVATEFKRNPATGNLPDWIQIRELTARSTAQAARWVKNDYVDMGEAEAIALALQQHSDWLLTDDSGGATVCRRPWSCSAWFNWVITLGRCVRLYRKSGTRSSNTQRPRTIIVMDLGTCRDRSRRGY
jgi:hypothetical protein